MRKWKGKNGTRFVGSNDIYVFDTYRGKFKMFHLYQQKSL
jgi:hypothetical protein